MRVGARTERGGQGEGTQKVRGRGGGGPGSGARGSTGREEGIAARQALTAAERGLAVPVVQAGGFPAGLPQGQVVLVVGRDPGRAQHGPQVQTQRQEDAHQPYQLQRGEHRHTHLLHAAARRSHAPGAAVSRPAGGEDARRVRRAGFRTFLEGKQRLRGARELAPLGLRASRRRELGVRRWPAEAEVLSSRRDADPTASLRHRTRASICPRSLRARSAPAQSR